MNKSRLCVRLLIILSLLGVICCFISPPKIAYAASTCNVSVFQLVNPYTNIHLYTVNHIEIASLTGQGWQNNGAKFQGSMCAAEYGKSNAPIYRLYNPNSGNHFWTKNTAETSSLISSGWKYEGVAWYEFGNTSIYRLYNAANGDHYYTKKYNEVLNMVNGGWCYENIAFYGL